MGCDLLVALGSATVHHNTVFGLNLFAADRVRYTLRSAAASLHSPDESIRTAHVEVPQVRQTCAVLGLQVEGSWGLVQGCNEHQVSVATTGWRCRRALEQIGLSGSDLVRLALERSHTAVNAVEVLTDLIARHGHGQPHTALASAFLIADPQEAFVLEVAGNCWALLKCQESRAVADVGLIRQDWQRLSPGLAEHAIGQGWWQDDGTKLDFVGSLGQHDGADAWPLKRWGKATLALAQQSGAVDGHGLRRILQDHFESHVRRHELSPPKVRLLASLVLSLDQSGVALAWIARGAPGALVYFPVTVGADLPESWLRRPLSLQTDEGASTARDLAERLQVQFDQDAEDFRTEAKALMQRQETPALRRLGQAMMQKHCEQWDSERPYGRVAAAAAQLVREEQEAVPFAFG